MTDITIITGSNGTRKFTNFREARQSVRGRKSVIKITNDRGTRFVTVTPEGVVEVGYIV